MEAAGRLRPWAALATRAPATYRSRTSRRREEGERERGKEDRLRSMLKKYRDEKARSSWVVEAVGGWRVGEMKG